MIANVGAADRAIRVVVGTGLIGFGMYEHGPWLWAGLVGVVLVLTGLFRVCPAYWLLRISTVAGKSASGSGCSRSAPPVNHPSMNRGA